MNKSFLVRAMSLLAISTAPLIATVGSAQVDGREKDDMIKCTITIESPNGSFREVVASKYTDLYFEALDGNDNLQVWPKSISLRNLEFDFRLISMSQKEGLDRIFKMEKFEGGVVAQLSVTDKKESVALFSILPIEPLAKELRNGKVRGKSVRAVAQFGDGRPGKLLYGQEVVLTCKGTTTKISLIEQLNK